MTCKRCGGNNYVKHNDQIEACDACPTPDTDEFDPISRPRHYVKGGGIEPLDFITSRGLDFVEGNIIKYVVRYQEKGGTVDLEKAKFYLDRLIKKELEQRNG